MHLHPEEPEARSWELLGNVELAVRVRALLPAENPALVLVDGRSGSGKSTFAERLARLLDGAVVHSDDIAWHHDPIHWEDVLVGGVIAPWRRGEAVYFRRPPGWVAQGRPGAVEMPPRPVLIVESVGAGRSGLAARAELVVWVQSDRDEARRRGVQRDVVLGRTPKEEAFWDEWMRAEEPFLADDRPWSRASLVVNGTPEGAMQADSVLAPGPLDA